jgi:hypothetical protein
MKNKKSLLAAIAVFGASATLLATGTYAWYQFSQTASVRFDGTALKAGNHMQLGFYSKNKLTGFAAYGLTEQALTYTSGSNTVAGGYAYWTSNEPDQDVLNYVMGQQGFTTNVLTPVTTTEFNADMSSTDYGFRGAFSNVGSTTYSTAKKTDYVEFTLVMRLIDNDGKNLTTESLNGGVTETVGVSKNIYLNGFSAEAEDKTYTFKQNGVNKTATVNVGKAMRFGFKSYTLANLYNDNAPTKLDIIDPSLTGQADFAAVKKQDISGVIDLNGDGVWDYKRNPNTAAVALDGTPTAIPNGEMEYYYGDSLHNGVALTKDNYGKKTTTGIYGGEFDPIANPFDGGETCKGTYPFVLGTSVNQYYEYRSLDRYYLSNKANSDESKKSTPIAVTDADSSLAFVKCNLWIEGWDSDCVNGISELKYSATIDFAADELN